MAAGVSSQRDAGLASPVTLSGSSLSTFLRCGMQWEFAYVKSIKRPPKIRQLIGVATHEAVEINYRHKFETFEDLPESDVLDAFSTAYDRQIGDVEDSEEDPAAAKDSGVEITRIYRRQVSPSVQPVLIEEPVTMTVNGIPYSGWIDLTDQDNRIRDTKTTAKRPAEDTYLLNMTGYAMAFRSKTGTTESGITLDYLVRTKSPYYLPVKGVVEDDDINRFASILEVVYAAINEGRFVPNGIVSGACNWCGYNDICPAYKTR